MMKTLQLTGKYLGQRLTNVEVNKVKETARNGFDPFTYLKNFKGFNIGHGSWTK